MTTSYVGGVILGFMLGTLGSFATQIFARWLRAQGKLKILIRDWHAYTCKGKTMDQHRATLEEADWADYYISVEVSNRKEVVVSLSRPRIILLDTVGVTIAESAPQPKRQSLVPHAPQSIEVITIAPLQASYYEWAGRFEGEALRLFRVAPTLYLTFEDSEGRHIRIEVPGFRDPKNLNQWPN
jgi:hypothetical protein